MSDFNLTKLNTKELSANLKASIEYGGNVFLVARRGSGKTEISKQVISEVKINGKQCKELYLNASVLERSDFGGFPRVMSSDPNRKYVDYMLPSYYEQLCEGDTPVVALLDEVDKADPSLLAALLEFTQFKSMNGRKLKNLVCSIMTGNLISESGARPPLPLLDRAEKYLVEANYLHWLQWASESGKIHPSITAYIADNPEDLFGEVDPGELYADSSPRGWKNASNLVAFGEENKWAHSITTNKVAGCVGKKIGIKYDNYFTHYQILMPLVEKIMKGEKVSGFSDLEPSKQMVACMTVCSKTSKILDELKDKKVKPEPVGNVAKFLGNVDPEMALIGIRSQIGLQRVVSTGLDDDPAWDTILRNIVKRLNG